MKPYSSSILRLGIASVLTLAASPAATFNIANGDVAGWIAAIQTANTNGDSSNVINLAPQGTYVLTAAAEYPTEYNSPGAAGLPVIRSQVTINGNGATVQRNTASGTPDFVLLEVSGRTATCGDPSCFTNPSLTLNQITLTGGSLGGLGLNSATAVVQNSTITQNIGSPNSDVNGGGIHNMCGNLTLLNSTVSYNVSNSAFGGGGIFLWQFSCAPGMPTANISFSTIFENSNPGWGRGNAIGTNAPGGQVAVKNSILASPSHPTEGVCNQGAIVSLGHNLGGDASCAIAFTGPGDINNANPQLGPTVNNGGPTSTDFPAVNSPAIFAVPAGYCADVSGNLVTTDQRGFPRQCPTTIGSVEFEGLYNVCLLYDPTKAVPSSATDPIKLYLCDANANDLSSSATMVHATGVTQTSTSISGPVQSPGNANPDSDFRFDSTLGTGGGYIFNLRTTGMTTGTYKLNFTVTGDSFVYSASFQVK